MANLSLENLHLEPPSGFAPEELVASWRVPVTPGLSDPKLLLPQAVVRPNLTVTRVKVDDPEIETIAARAADDLMTRILGIQGMKASQIEFADGARGVLLEYAFPVMQFVVVQMQAMRVDDHTLTTLVICTEASRLTPEVREQYLASLRSAAVKG